MIAGPIEMLDDEFTVKPSSTVLGSLGTAWNEWATRFNQSCGLSNRYDKREGYMLEQTWHIFS